MFLHIGGSHIVFNSDLIGIFNYNLLESDLNKKVLNHTGGNAVTAGSRSANPKTFVVTDTMIYTSPISSLTLSRRQNRIYK